MANSHSKMFRKILQSTLRKDQRDMLRNMIKLIPQLDVLVPKFDAKSFPKRRKTPAGMPPAPLILPRVCNRVNQPKIMKLNFSLNTVCQVIIMASLIFSCHSLLILSKTLYIFFLKVILFTFCHKREFNHKSKYSKMQ